MDLQLRKRRGGLKDKRGSEHRGRGRSTEGKHRGKKKRRPFHGTQKSLRK